MRILLIDHEDSFVHNLEQAMQVVGADVRCVRCTTPVREVVRIDPDGIVLSPGPGHPSDRRITGLARDLLDRWQSERPFFGVCLGHQLIGEHFGARVVHAAAPVHGELGRVDHDQRGIFEGVPTPFSGARYHSLVVDPGSVPADLEISARGGHGIVMGLRHRRFPVESVQFHPESYLTVPGPKIVQNFLEEVRR
jgi:anthranilate synthase/aminodeoxychorismate synthase-like glutamine amidotransferase